MATHPKHRLDAAWLEAQYDNRARVPAHPRALAGWAEASRLVREQYGATARLDLPYGSGPGAADDPAQRLDIFVPDSSAAAGASSSRNGGAPVLVFLHGGYWRALDKSDFSFVAPVFTAEGALVVVVNYGLCPTVRIDDIALQVARAVAWVWEHAAEHGGDPERIAVAGHSAGGHLAALLLSCRWQQLDERLPAALLSGALAISGLYDLEPLRHTPFLQADLQLTPHSVARLSPAFFPRPKTGKLYAAVGADESDEFLRHNLLIREVWGPTAVPVCETIPGADHFTVLQSLVDPRGRLHELALRLLGLR